MNGSEYHLAFLQQAIENQPEPPCDACIHSHQCVSPDYCTPYQVFIETGSAVSPPRKLPTGAE